jgi:hypothetical protein
VCLGIDGAFAFQNIRSVVIVLRTIEQAPYLIGIHYMAHITNLVVQNLSTMPMVSKLENLLQALYSFFFTSPKHHLEFTKLTDIVDIEGLKVL